MPVSSAPTFNNHTGNGATLVFAYGFRILDATHLAVYLAGVLQASGYTVQGVGAAGGGTVTFTVAPGNAVAIKLQRAVPRTRLTDYVDNGDFTAQDIDDDQDLQTMQVQDIGTKADHSIVFPFGDLVTALPSAAARASRVLGFDASGNLVVLNAAQLEATLNNISINYYSQAFSGNGATTAFTLSSAPEAQNALMVYISGVRQSPGTGYTVSGTTLTFVTAPPTGTSNVLAVWSNAGILTTVPADASVTLIKLADGVLAATAAGRLKMADGYLTFVKIDSAAIATQAEAEAGTVSNKLMTPQRTSQAITALTPVVGTKLYIANTTGAALASLATFAAAGAWSAWTAVNATARVNTIYGGALANVRALTVYSKLSMVAGAGPIQQKSSVALSANNTDLQDNARIQQIRIGAGGADSLAASDFAEYVVPVAVSGGVINFYYATRRESGNHASEDWSVFVTGVHLS